MRTKPAAQRGAKVPLWCACYSLHFLVPSGHVWCGRGPTLVVVTWTGAHSTWLWDQTPMPSSPSGFHPPLFSLGLASVAWATLWGPSRGGRSCFGGWLRCPATPFRLQSGRRAVQYGDASETCFWCIILLSLCACLVAVWRGLRVGGVAFWGGCARLCLSLGGWGWFVQTTWITKQQQQQPSFAVLFLCHNPFH